MIKADMPDIITFAQERPKIPKATGPATNGTPLQKKRGLTKRWID